MRWNIFWRYALEFSMIYPGAMLCFLPMRGHLRLSSGRLFALVFSGITAMIAACSLLCTRFGWSSNALLPPVLLLSFLAYRLVLTPDISLAKAVYVFISMAALLAVCPVLTTLMTARSELLNPETVFLASTSLLCLGLSVLIILFFLLFMRSQIVWLVEQFHMRRVWHIAWLHPALFICMYVLIQPRHPDTVLVNRVQEMGVLLAVASLVVYQFLTFLFYRIARELTVNARLAEENQLLTIEAHRYQELRTHMEETRLLRHDFRQHLRVISSLSEAGKTDELRQYLRQYDQELGGEQLSICANAAVDAIAGYYNHLAASRKVPIEWKLSLPASLPLPETDICMLLGNLLENALYACGALPAQQRSIRVICQMLSPAMVGLIVENAYDGKMKKEGNIFLSTRHGGTGFGLQSVQNTVRRYHGKLTIETENQLFSVNILLNL